MKTISQRELSDDHAAVLRAVERGETYTVTRHGVPVARLVPFTGDLRCDRPARKRPTYGALQRVRAQPSTEALLIDLREGR